MTNLEMCPLCSQGLRPTSDRMKPMVLSGDDKEMQCDICNHSFKLPESETLRRVARLKRSYRYC